MRVFIGYRDSTNTRRRSVKAKFRPRVLRASEQVFEWLRLRDVGGDACRPVLAKPLFMSKVTRVAHHFPAVGRNGNVNASAPAISNAFRSITVVPGGASAPNLRTFCVLAENRD